MATKDSKDNRQFLEVLPSQESKPRRSLGNFFGLKKTKSGSSNVPSDLPPPYQANDPISQAEKSQAEEDGRYAFLREYDIVFLIDDSGSMLWEGWREAEKALKAILPTCATYDEDGIDIEFLNSKQQFPKTNNVDEIERIFKQVTPSGRTPTGRRLRELFENYEERFVSAGKSWDAVKPQNIIVITDGGATDGGRDNLANVIQNFSAKLDRWETHATQLGVQFFQIGDFPDAAAMLEMLDDQLWGRDIVDTVKYTGRPLDSNQILKVVGGAVSKKLDGQTFDEIRRERKLKAIRRAEEEANRPRYGR